jgi:NAD(P)-dependent dehydrogenase (short-subunit alcohol dehydrogenase family)
MTKIGLSGKTIVIVGGSSGIGFAVAKAALADNALVHIGSHSEEKIAGALAKLEQRATGHVVDVTDDMSVARFFEKIGPVDHLIFTAGDWLRRKTALGPTFSLTDAKESFDVRFWGLLRIIQHAVPQIAQDGSITLTSGVLAHRPQLGSALSTALTGATEHLAKGLAIDLAPIRVNVVVPGLIATEAWERLPDDVVQKMVEGQSIPRIGQPDEVAEAFLSFMRATYTTGQSLIVDGGMVFR